MATMTMNADPQKVMDGIPRLRWDTHDHRFHYSMPIAAEPGSDGFVLLQEFEHLTSYGAWALPEEEKEHIVEMERMNQMVQDVEATAHLHDNIRFLERQRAHSEEYHDRDVIEEDMKPRAVKKHPHHDKRSPKHVNKRQQKSTRVGRVHQPR